MKEDKHLQSIRVSIMVVFMMVQTAISSLKSEYEHSLKQDNQVEALSSDSYNPSCRAAVYHFTRCIQLLMKNEGKMSPLPYHKLIMDSITGGGTLLNEDDHLANLVELLIEKGANKNAEDVYGDTPLHYAIYYGLPCLVERLLSFGACVETRNQAGVCPLSLACLKYPWYALKGKGECKHREKVIQLLLLMGKAPLDKLSKGTRDDLATLGITENILEKTRSFEKERHKGLIGFLSTIPKDVVTNVIIEYDNSFDTKILLFTKARSSPTKECRNKKRKRLSVTHST